MRSYWCRRCEEAYNGPKEGQIVIVHKEQKWDLCADCCEDLQSFLDDSSPSPEGEIVGYVTEKSMTVPPIKVTATVNNPPYKNKKPDLPDFMEAGGRNY